MNRLTRLRPSSKILSDFYVFDTETAVKNSSGYNWNLEGEFIFGVIYGENYCKVIHDKTEMIETFKEPRFRKKKVFAHNAEFDLMVLYGNIFDLDPKAIFNGSRFIGATNGNTYFADSANIFVGRSVAEIGKMLHIEKPGLGGELMLSKSIGKDEINRCIKDCEIVWEALIKTFEFAGDIKITQASLSMVYFRRYHLPYNIDYNENAKLFWESYYGGRTEAFKIGKTESKVIDVNSMYPYAMKTATYPNPKYLKKIDNPDLDIFMRYLSDHEGLAKCKVFHPEIYFGLLPYKDDKGKLTFPTGTFTGVWNFPEIRFAIQNGLQILQVDFCVIGQPMQSIFTTFVDQLNIEKIKAENSGNEFERDRAKRFSNSLYGKFGQRIKEEQIYLKDYEKEFDLIQEYQRKGLFIKLSLFNAQRKDAFIILKNTKGKNLSHAIPSFASYVTSFARVLLLKKLIELQPYKVTYCDTDSVFFEVDPGIENEYHLGGWKLENKIVTEIKGLKNYKYIKSGKEYWRVKGIPTITDKKVIKIEGENRVELDKVKQTGEKEFTYINLTKTKEALRQGKQPRKLAERVKQLKHEYDKRKVFLDGSTEPININELNPFKTVKKSKKKTGKRITEVYTPSDWLLRYFATGGRVNTKDAIHYTGLKPKDLIQYISNKALTFDRLVMRAMEETFITDNEQELFNEIAYHITRSKTELKNQLNKLIYA